MDPQQSQWQTQALSQTYLEGVRGAIPLAEAQIGVLLKVVQLWVPEPKFVLDLGCGDGILGRAVLDRYPGAQALFVDFSESMLQAARDKFSAGPDRHSTVRFVQSDFSSAAWLADLDGDPRFDLVVSGFAIHHQADARKRALYTEVLDLLAPGGVFVNLEHVASSTPAVSALFDDYFVDHLYAFHSRSDGRRSWQEVAETYYSRPDKVENILASVEQQCAWLREIGFQDVDCFFKVFELALFGGRKPG